MDADEFRILIRFRLAGVAELRVIWGEFPVIQPGFQRNWTLGILGNSHPIMRDVGRARRDQPDVQQAAHGPSIALVDGIPISIELKRLIKMRPFFDRSAAIILDFPAPEDDFPGRIAPFEFQPDIERVDRPAGKEVADLARAHDHIDTRRRTRLKPGVRPVQRRRQLRDFP
jgi:hypothetical protein